MSDYVPNPKFEGSNLVACFPQGKPCPIGCNQCYAHHPGCYTSMDRPNVPDPAWVGDRIVRMNDIGDSNVDRDLVIQTAARYQHAYFNTSIPLLNFPGPVVLTVNPKEEEPITWSYPGGCGWSDNLMAVRIRLSPANADSARKLVNAWLGSYDVPVLVSHMRYYTQEALAAMLARPRWLTSPPVEADDYVCRKHVLNECWQPSDALATSLERYLGMGWRGVYLCGGAACKDCHQCESLYWLCRRRMDLVQRIKDAKA